MRRSVNALRHVTYRERDTWIAESDLVVLPLGQRIKYVRENLVDEAGGEVTQAAIARAVGMAEGHHAVMRWEKGTEPRKKSRQGLSDLTGGAYRPEAFSRRGAEEIAAEWTARRLRSLEREVAWLKTQLALAFGALGLQLEPPAEQPPAQSDGARP